MMMMTDDSLVEIPWIETTVFSDGHLGRINDDLETL